MGLEVISWFDGLIVEILPFYFGSTLNVSILTGVCYPSRFLLSGKRMIGLHGAACIRDTTHHKPHPDWDGRHFNLSSPLSSLALVAVNVVAASSPATAVTARCKTCIDKGVPRSRANARANTIEFLI